MITAEQHIAAGHRVTADWTILYQHSTELDADTGTLRVLTDTGRAADGGEGETELFCHNCLDTVQPSDWTKVDIQ